MNTQLIESLKSLSVAERIQLVEDLWDTIAVAQEDFGLSVAQQEELERRLEAVERGESPLSTWDEVKSRILAGQ